MSNTVLQGPYHRFRQRLQAIQIIEIEPLQHDPVETDFYKLRELFGNLCACSNEVPFFL